MRSVAYWSVQLVSCVLFFGNSYLASAEEDTGIDKGNGTLPVRMEGHLTSRTNKVVAFESVIASVTANSSKFNSACELSGPTINSFGADGSFYLGNNYTKPYVILEICRDSKGPGIEIIVAGPEGEGTFRFYGGTKEVLGAVVSMEGTLTPGDYRFFLQAADESESNRPNH